MEEQKTVLLSDAPEAPPAVSGTAPTVFSDPTLGSTALAALSQRYEILGAAGHGSMGNVYKARDRETNETVALKLLKPEIASDQATMERFKNELLFARKITHKNVCRVHEFNRIGGIAYTSMEFVEGESLRSVLNRFGGLPARKGVDIVQQMCSGLKEAHAQGIVHRDLKPENVMIDLQGNVKIMDFGIARSMEVETRLTGSMVGTPQYMAPEQVAGKAIDYRTDIYSLGLIAYEIFTGVPAFRADNAVAVALKQMQELPLPPHEVDPNISPLIERVILKCLEKVPGRRYQSIVEVETAFRLPGAPAPVAGPAPAASTLVPQPPVAARTEFAPGIPAAEAPLRAARTTPTRSTSVAGHLFSWLLLFAALAGAGYAARRWIVPVAFPNLFSLPPVPAAPEPPDFAFASSEPTDTAAPPAPATIAPATATAASDTPASTPPATSEQKSTAASSPAAANAPAQSDTDTSKAATPAAASVAASPKPKKIAPPPQARAASAAPEATQDQTDENSENPPAALAANAPAYIWAGRYERKDRADAAAKEIRDLGLPVVVLPRQTPRGQAFAIFTGPFSGRKLKDTTELLQADGFTNARAVQAQGNGLGLGASAAANSRQTRDQNQ